MCTTNFRGQRVKRLECFLRAPRYEFDPILHTITNVGFVRQLLASLCVPVLFLKRGLRPLHIGRNPRTSGAPVKEHKRPHSYDKQVNSVQDHVYSAKLFTSQKGNGNMTKITSPVLGHRPA